MAATKTIVTRDIAFLGMRVCRGRDWSYHDQDMWKGVPQAGTIIEIRPSDGGSMDFRVQWDNSNSTNSYNGGKENQYHLYLWEDDVVKEVKKTEAYPDIYGYYEKAGRNTSGEKFAVGDTVEFVKHVYDSDCNSSLKLSPGKTYKVTSSFYSDTDFYGADAVYIEGTTWAYSSQCFRRAKTVAATVGINPANVKIGDEVKFHDHSIDSAEVGLVIGNWYEVYTTNPFSIKTSKGGIWYISASHFSESRSPIKTTRKKISIHDVNIGDGVYMYEHHYDSSTSLKIGMWYRVMEIKQDSSLPIGVAITDSTTGRFFKVWYASIECFSDVSKNYRSGPKMADVSIGDMVTYKFDIGPGTCILRYDKNYEVVAKTDTKISVKAEGYGIIDVPKECFGGNITKATKVEGKKAIDYLRDEMSKSTATAEVRAANFVVGDWVECVAVGIEEKKNGVSKGDRFEIAYATAHFNGKNGIAGKTHGNGTYMYSTNFVKSSPMIKKEEEKKWMPQPGDWVECVNVGTWEMANGVKKGDVRMVDSISSLSIRTRGNPTGKDYWMGISNFVPSKKSASISSSIKIKKNDKHKSVRISSIPGVSGSTFKVQRPAATFRKGQVHRGSAVRVRASEARTGRSHS